MHRRRHQKDRNMRPLLNFVMKCWYNTRNRLHVWDDYLLINEGIVTPTQLRQTVLDSIHLPHPGSAAMLDLSQQVRFLHIHRSIVHIAENYRQCTKQGKILEPVIGKQHSFQTDPVVESNEEVFAGPSQWN